MLSPSVTAPPQPTPAETIAEALNHIGPLHGLTFEDRLWLARNGEERIAAAGEVLFEEGAPAEHMMLILKGEIHVRRQRTGPMSLFIGRSGQMTGLLPFSLSLIHIFWHETMRCPSRAASFLPAKWQVETSIRASFPPRSCRRGRNDSAHPIP